MAYPRLLPSLYLWSICSLLASTAELKDLYTQWYKGEGTYYGANGHLSGTCQLSSPETTVGGSSSINKLVAMNVAQWFGSLSCGMCVRMKGAGKGLGTNPITGDHMVYVKDLCPGCKAGDLDLSETGDGRWDIEMKAVECPVDATNAKIKYKFQGSNAWYLKVQTRNERVPITSFKLWEAKINSWGDMKRTTDGFWLLGSGVSWTKPIPKPLKVRLFSSVNGQTIEDSIPLYDNDKEIAGNGVQFTSDSSLESGDGGGSVTQATSGTGAPTPAPTPAPTQPPAGNSVAGIQSPTILLITMGCFLRLFTNI